MAQANVPYSSSLGLLSLSLPNMLSRLGVLGGGLLDSAKMAGGTIDKSTIPLTNFIFNKDWYIFDKIYQKFPTGYFPLFCSWTVDKNKRYAKILSLKLIIHWF